MTPNKNGLDKEKNKIYEAFDVKKMQFEKGDLKQVFSFLLDMWKDDYQFKTVIGSALSALIGFFFIIFNGVLGIVYHSIWHGSICVYYILLFVAKGSIVNLSGRQLLLAKKTGEDIFDNPKIKTEYYLTHILLLLIDLALIFPIAYMVKGNRSYEFGMAPALVMALYTTYRIVMGIINLKRTKKVDNVFIKDLRIISLKDALVAVLTLQNALVIVSGETMDSQMNVTAGTSAAIWLTMLALSIVSFTLRKKPKSSDR